LSAAFFAACLCMFTDVPSRTGKEYVFSPVTRYCHQPTTSILLCLLGPFDSNMSDRLHRIPQTSCMYIEPDHSQHDRSRPVLLYSVPRSQPHAIAEFACVYHTREEVEEEWGGFCAMSPHIIIRKVCVCGSMATCIAEGRKALANGRNPGRQDRRAAPMCSSCSQKWDRKPAAKTGPQYCRKKEGFQYGGPVYGTRVLHTQSAVSSGDSGTFRLRALR
jgi:hypothetical protein